MKLKMIVVLTLVCVVSAFLLAKVFQVTNIKIEKNKIDSRMLSLLETSFPYAKEYKISSGDFACTVYDSGNKVVDIVKFVEKMRDTVWSMVDTSGVQKGIVCRVFPRGYSTNIETFVGINEDTSIIGIRTATPAEGLKETPGLGTKINELWFKHQFIGKKLVDMRLKKDGGNLDAITAATISSRAVVKGVKEAINRYSHFLADTTRY